MVFSMALSTWVVVEKSSSSLFSTNGNITVLNTFKRHCNTSKTVQPIDEMNDVEIMM